MAYIHAAVLVRSQGRGARTVQTHCNFEERRCCMTVRRNVEDFRQYILLLYRFCEVLACSPGEGMILP